MFIDNILRYSAFIFEEHGEPHPLLRFPPIVKLDCHSGDKSMSYTEGWRALTGSFPVDSFEIGIQIGKQNEEVFPTRTRIMSPAVL